MSSFSKKAKDDAQESCEQEGATQKSIATSASAIFDFSGSVAIVTGGTKGLGRGIAQTFLSSGADVVICARNAPKDPVAAPINTSNVARNETSTPNDAPAAPNKTTPASNKTALFVAADVRNPDDIAKVVNTATETFGRVDVLVNNAGGAPPVASAEASPRFNERVLALNLLAPMMFSQAVHPVMNQQDTGGVVLNISSVSALRPNPFGVAYGAAKAGLINMSETLAAEWAPKIRVLTVTAGLLVTENAHLYYGDEEGIAKVGNTITLGRMGAPDDIAGVCLFLASDKAKWMTGANIMVHGGNERPSYLDASTGEVRTAGG